MLAMDTGTLTNAGSRGGSRGGPLPRDRFTFQGPTAFPLPREWKKDLVFFF